MTCAVSEWKWDGGNLGTNCVSMYQFLATINMDACVVECGEISL
jgi:hypothetical protein